MEEELSVAFDDNTNELLNQRSEILNNCRCKKDWFLYIENVGILSL